MTKEPSRLFRQHIHRRGRRRRSGSPARSRWVGMAGLLLLLTAGLFLGVGSAVGAAFYALLTEDIPDIASLETLEQGGRVATAPAVIYAWNSTRGEEQELVPIYEITGPLDGELVWLTPNEIPTTLIDATIAWENDAFREGEEAATNGLVALTSAWRGNEGEAVTLPIARQVVRHNLLVAGDNGIRLAAWRRSLQEQLLTRRLLQTYRQEQILTWYLNTQYYGRLAFGVEAAAQAYFDKSARDLNLAEAATIAALAHRPNDKPPADPDGIRERQLLVLQAMVEADTITASIAQTAASLPLTFSSGLGDRFDVIAPHFAQYVQRELEDRFGPRRLLTGGLKVVTSLDLEMQQQAECVARAHLDRLAGNTGPNLPADERARCAALGLLAPLRPDRQGIDHQVTNAAVVALEPATAEIKAMVGSLNYWDDVTDGYLNAAVDATRQPGTILSPFAYLTALSQGYSAATMVLDVPIEFDVRSTGRVLLPQNADSSFHGPMRLRQALGNDYYVPALQIMSWVGADRVIRTARSLGLTDLDETAREQGLALVLGGGEVRLIDLVFAFAVLDNMGVMIGQPDSNITDADPARPLDPVAILRVTDPAGQVILEQDTPERREIVSPELAFLLNDMLSDRSARCQALGCPNLLELPDSRPAAVKAGFSQDFADAWTIGYTPELVTGVWVGNNDRLPMKSVSGLLGAAPIWQAFTSWALADEDVSVWPEPPGLVEMAVCETSGMLPTPYCPTVSERFIPGTQPLQFDRIYQEFALNRENGRLATVYTPAELIERRIFKVYPDEAAAWVRANSLEQPPTEYDTIEAAGNGNDDVAILSPRPFAQLRDQVEIVGNVRGDDFAFYRLAYFQGLTPADIQVIADNVPGEQEAEVLGVWDVSQLSGLYTLLLSAFREDGTFREVSLHVTVDQSAPSIEFVAPQTDQEFSVDDGWLFVAAEAHDNIGVAEVEFRVDGRAFHRSDHPPHRVRWDIQGPGCHDFQAKAFDAAGNFSLSRVVPICIVTRP